MKTYLHGTNSLALLSLKATDFQLISPNQALKKYQVVPFSGGAPRYYADAVSFGALETLWSTNAKNLYTLHRILDICRHGQDLEPFSDEENTSSLKSAVSELITSACMRWHRLLIHIARAKQTGQTTAECLIDDEIATIRKQIRATRQYYCLWFLLGAHLNVNECHWVNYNSEESNFLYFPETDAKDAWFSFEQICSRIESAGLDIEAIVNGNDFSVNKLQPVLDLLNPPNKTLFIASAEMPQDPILPEDLPWTDLKERKHFRTPERVHGDFAAISFNAPHQTVLFFQALLQGMIRPTYLEGMRVRITEHLLRLDEKCQLFEQLIKKESINLLTDQMAVFSQKPFPIIFGAHDCEHIKLKEEDTQEYQAGKPLKIGQEIQEIATDTLEHKKLLNDFFKENSITVKITLFRDLACQKLELMVNSLRDHFQTIYDKKFKGTNSTGILEIKAILEDNDKTALEKVKTIMEIATAKIKPGFGLWYSQSHLLFGHGRHPAVHDLYKVIANIYYPEDFLDMPCEFTEMHLAETLMRYMQF